MDTKPRISYVKNGKLKEEKFTKLKEILLFNYESYLTSQSPQITNSYSSIHIKNYNFNKVTNIEQPFFTKCKVLIFENCTFEGNKLSITGIRIVKLINPKFKEKISIDLTRCDDVEIILEEETKDIELSIFNVENLNLTANKNLTKIFISTFCDMLHIKNFYGTLLSDSIPTVQNLKILLEDSSVKINEQSEQKEKLIESLEKVTLINSNIESEFELNFQLLSKLILESSYIKAPIINFNILEELIFKEKEETILDTTSYIEVKDYINVNRNLIKNLSKEENLILTNSSFQNDLNIKRQELLFILKELSNIINNNLEEEKNKEKQKLFKQIEQNLDKRLTKKLSLERVDKYIK